MMVIPYLHLGLAIRHSNEFFSLDLLSLGVKFTNFCLLVGRLAISTSHLLLGSLGDLIIPIRPNESFFSSNFHAFQILTSLSTVSRADAIAGNFDTLVNHVFNAGYLPLSSLLFKNS